MTTKQMIINDIENIPDNWFDSGNLILSNERFRISIEIKEIDRTPVSEIINGALIELFKKQKHNGESTLDIEELYKKRTGNYLDIIQTQNQI